MKAEVKQCATAEGLNGLHRKSNSAIGRHRESRATVGVAELAAVASRLPATASGLNTSEEMQIYFSKLKELVPFIPRNRKLSKLEIIQYVIDYICDLQLALESQPTAAAFSPSSLCGSGSACVLLGSSTAATHRQPLGVIPNNGHTNGPNTCAVQEATFSSSSLHSLPIHSPLPNL